MISNEARTIALAAAELRERKTPFLLATVVRVSGSSYRRPGARLLATAEKRIAGSVSGGCLERDLIRTGFWRTRSGPVVVRYDSSDLLEEDDRERSTEDELLHDRGAQLGCGGIIDVLLEHGDPSTHEALHNVTNDTARNSGGTSLLDPITFVQTHTARADRAAVIATVFQSSIDGVPLGTRWCFSEDHLHGSITTDASRSPELSEHVISDCRHVLARKSAATTYRHELSNGGEIETLVEAILPPPHLFVFGAGLDVIPVLENARRLGWNLTVWDPSSRFDVRDRFVGLADVVDSNLDTVRDRIDDVVMRVGSDAFAIVMSHNRQLDQRALEMLSASRATYIGVLGPRHRTEALIASIDAHAHAHAPQSGRRLIDDPRVHAPVGLDLGAETPEEIALSITAEILALSRKANALELNKSQNIHSSLYSR